MVELALRPDAAAVAGDDVFADVQTEAHATRTAGHGIFGLIEEAEHGFMRDGSPDFAPDAAADAWTRTLALFRKNLS